MYFDRNNATLVATPDDLTALARCLGPGAADGGASAVPGSDGQWEANGVSRGGRIDSTVAGIVEVMNQPCRTVALERFDGRQADVVFVAWDRAGRATIASGAGEEHLAITATQFNLLPALLTQAVRLHPQSASGARPAMATTAATIERAISGEGPVDGAMVSPSPAPVDGPAPGDGAAPGDGPVARDAGGPTEHEAEGSADDLAAVLGSLRHAWRASGSWNGKATDTSLTVIFAGDEGLWTVKHDAMQPGSQPTPETAVCLQPSSPARITSLLGDVVTGRAAVPTPLTA